MAQSCYRLTRSRQHLAMLGLAGKHTYLPTVKGRKSGRLNSTPVALVEDGRCWLVAPYGSTEDRQTNTQRS